MWRRAAAWLIDEIARSLFYPLILIVLFLLTGSVPATPAPGEVDLAVALPQAVLRVGLSWIFWSYGTSPGAMALGLRIVDGEGAIPGSRRGGIRAVMEIASLSMFLIGYAWALVSRRKQTWHDMVAGTYVVLAPRDGGARG